MNDIAAVVVTFNRIEYLKVALGSYEEQKIKPKYLVVVNNCSSDGTYEYLEKWKERSSDIQKIVVNLDTNQGGAGGFYSGLEKAMELDVDWVWLADDDAYPEGDCFEKLIDAYDSFDDKKDIACLFTSVIRDGEYSISHRRVVKKGIKGAVFDWISETEYDKPYFRIDQGTYCGMLAKKSFLERTELTRKEFFIYYDDTEHTARLNKLGNMYCIPAARLNHDDGGAGSRLTWKEFYGVRNLVIFKKEQYGNYAVMMEIIKQYLLYCAPWKKDIPAKFKKMIRTGIRDGLKGKTGIHELYKPGWKV